MRFACRGRVCFVDRASVHQYAVRVLRVGDGRIKVLAFGYPGEEPTTSDNTSAAQPETVRGTA